jgi:hypothetical protein
MEKISPAESAKETTEENQIDKKELGEFTKKYSSFRRSEMASQIWQMRKERRQQKKQAEEQNLEVQQQKADIAKEINFQGGLFYWAKEILSEGDNKNGDDIVAAAANQQHEKDDQEKIKSIFAGKTKDECLEIIEGFKRDKSKLDYFFGRGDRKIKF